MTITDKIIIAAIAGTITLAVLLPVFLADTVKNAYQNRRRIGKALAGGLAKIGAAFAACLAEIGGCLA